MVRGAAHGADPGRLTDDVAEATRRLYDDIRGSEAHGAFIRAVDAAPRRPRDVVPGTVVAIVPAALYKEYKRSGADGRRIREAAVGLGLNVESVPLEPTGTLETNAAILRAWLRASPHQNVVLVSLSKGAADVKKALAADDDEAFRRVSVWISIGGLLEGTPLVPWLLSRERFPVAFRAVNRINGIDFSFLADIDRRPGGPLDFPLRLPPHLRLIHLLGFALPEHATNWLSRKFCRRLAPYGPSDGFMLLDDARRWPGRIYPLWGADHYFRTREDPRPLLERLLSMAVEPGALDPFFTN